MTGDAGSERLTGVAKEAQSLQARYRKRARRTTSGRYSVFDRAHLMALQQRDRCLLQQLRAAGCSDLGRLRILDVGCGFGQDLVRFVSWGARPELLVGIDALPERCEAAQRLHPGIRILQANAAALPFPDGSFDVALQFTTMSSILDEAVRFSAAAEINRVLAPGGLLIWYDFWLNPINRETHGISPKEIRALLPGYHGRLRRLTLAPPLARAVGHFGHLPIALLQGLWPFQTHYLGVLQSPEH